MSSRHPMHLISPYEVIRAIDPFPFDFYARKYLAQGDSWFSIGALPPTATSNLLMEMRLSRSAVAVNCARPGKFLTHMTDTSTDPLFVALLTGTQAYQWDALLISGGGNDLIDAASVGPAAPAALRLFATVQERGQPSTAAEYLSPAGWQTFANHMARVFKQLLDLRDRGVNRKTPLVLHNYSRMRPRHAPAGLGFGPWLAPALDKFHVPAGDWLAVSDELLGRLDGLLRRLIADREQAQPGSLISLVDSMAVQMTLAAAGSKGSSGDFANEIHPSRAGYTKLARAWEVALDALP